MARVLHVQVRENTIPWNASRQQIEHAQGLSEVVHKSISFKF